MELEIYICRGHPWRPRCEGEKFATVRAVSGALACSLCELEIPGWRWCVEDVLPEVRIQAGLPPRILHVVTIGSNGKVTHGTR